MGWADRFKRKEQARATHALAVKRLQKIHPGEPPRTIEAIIERIREIDADINRKTPAEKINER